MKRSEIEKHATQVLRDHGLLDIPVDPLKVAKALRIKVMNAVFSEKEKSGAVSKRASEFTIFVNVNEPSARKRFTIAHEIGHRMLHMEGAADIEIIDTHDNFRAAEVPYDKTWNEERRIEWEANTFAAALLMNENLVREKWEICKEPNILAWMFQVSTTAMLVRLKQFGLVPETT